MERQYKAEKESGGGRRGEEKAARRKMYSIKSLEFVRIKKI